MTGDYEVRSWSTSDRSREMVGEDELSWNALG
jgi:hypothetical protein